MRKNNFRHPLSFALSIESLAAWGFGPMFFVSDPIETKLREKVIYVTGLSGIAVIRDVAAGNAYVATDLIGVGMDGTISNAFSNTSNTTVFLGLNKPWYPFFVQLTGAASIIRFVFYYAGGDWPAAPPAGKLQLDINFNVHFETEEP